MNRAELQRRLERAASHEQWVDALARFFVAHRIVFGHGTDNARDEAYWLVRHQQGWRDETWAAQPDPGLIAALAALAERRVAERKPLAYLLGEAWFAGLRLEVDERVVIPRSPLAELIERGFEPWCTLRPGERVLDIGTGSGCLAVAAAYHCPGVLVDATDVSAAALAVAKRNVARHGLGDRIRLFQADLFTAPGERYRVIISNPPYVPDGELAALPEEYAHEPAEALAGGASGLELVSRILSGVLDYLEPGGMLIVEVGAGTDALMKVFPRLPAIWIEFERGGDGVLLLTREQLEEYF